VIHKALCGQGNKDKIEKKRKWGGNETQGTAINMLLNGILDDQDIQGHSSHKGDNVQLSQRTHKIVTVKTRLTAIALKTKVKLTM